MRRSGFSGITSLFLVGLLLSGCGPSPTPVDNYYPVTTDRTVYTARPLFPCTAPNCAYGFTVGTSYENRTDRPLYLARCYPDSPTPIYGVRLIAPRGEGESAYDTVSACVGHDEAIEVLPGETRTDTLHVRGSNAFDGETGVPFGVLEGKFYLSYQVQICPEEDLRCFLIHAAGYSNNFEVRLAR